ncbi:MAG TPA: hypothetical protein DD670_08685 [Planctomycetaceae bacterium]|nr:hypothetical protein [Planctomycetaceae bacterium]
MPNRFWGILILSAAVCLFGLPGAAAASAADGDGDGWYTAKKNQRVTLTLVGLTANRPGRYHVAIEGVRFPHSEAELLGVVAAQGETTHRLDQAVARRAVGTWMEQHADRRLAWQTKLTLTRTGGSSADETITWSNRAEDHGVTVALSADERVRLGFRVTVELFRDPDPKNRHGDTDRDGILDGEEASYARRGLGLGDPGRPDLILVVGHTHDEWRMTELTKTLLRTCFHQRGIRLHLATNDDESLGLCRPGLMTLDGAALQVDHALSLKEARRMRDATFEKPLASHGHLVVLSSRVSPNSSTGWGWAELPGAVLVVRSHLPMLGPDFHQYQAKTILHELGHNLGLCHPEESGEKCISGAIPKSERDPGKTVMGTPRADRGDPMAVLKNAWARPLDFSPTQWKNVRLDWVREENRPRKAWR